MSLWKNNRTFFFSFFDHLSISIWSFKAISFIITIEFLYYYQKRTKNRLLFQLHEIYFKINAIQRRLQ